MHDLINSIAVIQAVAPQTIQATVLTATAIDMQGCESLAVIVAVGNIADILDADNRIDVKIEHAEDDGTGNPAAYTDCADTDVTGASGLSGGVFLSVNAEDKENTRYAIAYNGGKRFVRLSAAPISLATGGPIAILAVKGNLAQKPQA